jgi:S1-C subfamily serine protease
MKWGRLIWLFLLLLVPVAVVGQQSAGLIQTNPAVHSGHPAQIAGSQIVTREGVVYKGVHVQKIIPDGLVIAYSQADGGLGIAKLKFKDLSDGLQQQFGYNPTNAAAFEKNQKKAESQWREQWKADDEKARGKIHEQQIADAESRAKWVGTGFFISDNGYLLTCFHVVTNATSIEVGTTHGLFSAQLVQSDPTKDVALLKVTGTFASLPLGSTNNVKLGESVFTIGFPRPDLQGWQPKLTRGEISSLSGMQDDPDEYQISVPVQPGNSGGALLDERGNVVGIVSATLRASEADIKDRIAPENVNYAINSACVKTMLDSVPGGLLKLKPENLTDDRKFEDVVQTSQAALALVLVQ